MHRAVRRMSIAAFVPARSGSKRLPGKNIKDLAGKPLVIWTLEACARAPSIDRVIFSTDSEEYWAIAKRHLGEEKLLLDFRVPDEAGDKVKIFDYLKDAREKIFGRAYTDFVMACLPYHSARPNTLRRQLHYIVNGKCPYFQRQSTAFRSRLPSTWTTAGNGSRPVTRAPW